MDMTNQPTIFDEPDELLEAPRYTLHGENREGIGQLQTDVVAWTFDGGIWWLTGADGSITGYGFDHYFWLSIRPAVL
jgi:hypothetical protein